jgi:hypothetical protein
LRHAVAWSRTNTFDFADLDTESTFLNAIIASFAGLAESSHPLILRRLDTKPLLTQKAFSAVYVTNALDFLDDFFFHILIDIFDTYTIIPTLFDTPKGVTTDLTDGLAFLVTCLLADENTA